MKVMVQIVLFFCFLSAKAQYQLDSVLYFTGDVVTKVEQYDRAAENISEKRYLKTDRESKKILDGSMEKSWYDKNRNVIRNIYSQFNMESQSWFESDKIERKYDVKNRLIGSDEAIKVHGRWEVQASDDVYYSQDSVVTKAHHLNQPYSKNVGYFNIQNNEIKSVNYLWDPDLKRWSPWRKTEYAYVYDSLIKESKSYVWNHSQWTPVEKISYLFDGDTKKSRGRISYTSENNEWILNEKLIS